MSSREQQLLQLNFKKNEHQRCFHHYKYGSVWTFDFWDIEELSDAHWNIRIENYKKFLREAENELEQDELYLLGRDSAQKQIKKKLLDKLNHLRSDYQQQTQSKLDKSPNYKRETELQAQITLLKDLINQITPTN